MFWNAKQRLGTQWVDSDIAPLGVNQAQATEIFLARARVEKGCTWRPSSAELYEIGRIIRATQGLPPALELAAAWICRMPLCEIADGLEAARLAGQLSPLLTTRISGLAPAEDPFLSCLQWCFNRLEPWAREGFALLGVFAGSFTPESASTVCLFTDPISVLFRLHDASFINRIKVRGGIRYVLPPAIRPYALSEFGRIGGQVETCERFVRHFRQLAEQKLVLAEGRADLPTSEGVAWFVDEWPNLLHAAKTAFALGDYESCWNIAILSPTAWPADCLDRVRPFHELASLAQERLQYQSFPRCFTLA